MNKFFTILAFLILPSSFCFSQKSKMQFGIINKYEQNLVTYEKDPKAEAVIIFDAGKSKFIDADGGYNIKFTRKKRIKILNTKGIALSKISIPFYTDGYGKTENITSIEAYCYNIENGKIVRKPLDQKNIFKEQINNNWKVKKFVFPDVKKGSIIEYKYTLETPFLFNLPDWTFQDKIPTIYSEYSVHMIPFYEYTYIAQGTSRFDFNTSTISENKRTWGIVNHGFATGVGNGIEFAEKINVYAMKDVPAFRDESYISSPEDYFVKIDFQLSKINQPNGQVKDIVSTWSKLNKGLLDNSKFGKYLNKSKKLAKKILASQIDISSKNETLNQKNIINYVKSNFNWNGVNSKYASKTSKEFLSQKSGNSTDINLFLCALLKAAGFDAKPAILSTRNHGKIRGKHPFAHAFNNTIVLVKSEKQTYLTDGTDALLAYNRIPINCINEKGLIVEKDNPKNWIKLSTKVNSINTKSINININPEQLIAETDLSIQTNEFESLALKNSLKNDTLKIKEQLIKNGLTEIQTISTLNYNRNNLAYIINCKGKSQIEKIGNKIIVSPFLNFPIKENKLKEMKRSYPIDLIYSRTKNFESTINIPEGYKVNTLPKNYKMDNGLAEIKLECVKNENNIIVKGTYSFKKSVYKPAEYGGIKSYFNTIIKKFNEPIVFEEIN
ncbi:DUF3857 domain-containing protein [Ancylomarina sp. DW003]|nr:DUF3857 domain-containing protein [Ancylomarina sp. DW003]MDE5421334.1 DUF3857 domain-containing protein [Ancylomarina sp. DW003]